MTLSPTLNKSKNSDPLPRTDYTLGDAWALHVRPTGFPETELRESIGLWLTGLESCQDASRLLLKGWEFVSGPSGPDSGLKSKGLPWPPFKDKVIPCALCVSQTVSNSGSSALDS